MERGHKPKEQRIRLGKVCGEEHGGLYIILGKESIGLSSEIFREGEDIEVIVRRIHKEE